MQRRRALTWLLATASAGVLLAAAAGATTSEGVRFDDHLQLGGRALVLNGTGVRGRAWIKGYVAGLYLERPARTAAEVLALTGPKRLRMVMLVEGVPFVKSVPAGEFIKAIDSGMRRNSSQAEGAALDERIARFDALVDRMGKVVRGDVVDLDYEPQRGMTFIFNGTARGEPIPGADFYAALLRAFIGEKPYDPKLRAGLLGIAD